MKIKIFILFLAFSQFAVGQSISTSKPSQTALSEVEFAKLKSDYSAMTKSESYISMKKNMLEFGTKLNGVPGMIVEPQDAWITWITANISKTKFASVEEANKLRQEGIDLTTKNQDKFADVYISMRKASREQWVSLLKSEREGEFK